MCVKSEAALWDSLLEPVLRPKKNRLFRNLTLIIYLLLLLAKLLNLLMLILGNTVLFKTYLYNKKLTCAHRNFLLIFNCSIC